MEIDLTAAPAQVALLPGEVTRLWQYQAALRQGPLESLQTLPESTLGPILRLRRGQLLRVNFENQLEEPTVVHWHGLRVPEAVDGHPRLALGPGGRATYEFPILNRAGTYWFHPHPHQRTGPQVYFGLAGLLIVADDTETALGLPTGEFDLPLVIQDRRFDRQNQLDYTGDPMNGFLGERLLINGQAQTRLEVAAAPYRLRLLNGSNARIYKLAWEDGVPLQVIATDGGLLAEPHEFAYLTLGPGERADLYVDFSATAVGTQRRLLSLAFESGAGGMGGMMGGGLSQGTPFEVLTVAVTRPGTGSAAMPRQLAAPAFFPAAEAVNHRRPRRFELTMGMVGLINGRSFEMEATAADEVVRLGDLEVWEFANVGGGMGMMGGMAQPHPMHIHGVQFQVLERQLEGGARRAYESVSAGFIDRGWKDTVLVMPGEVVRVLVKFEDYAGGYLYHCHNLEHEDGGMMRNYRIAS